MKIKTLLTIFFIEVLILPIIFIAGFAYHPQGNYFSVIPNEQIQILPWWIVIVIGVTFLITALFSFYASHRMFLSLQKLSKIIEAIKAGDFSVEIPEALRSQQDEVGSFARAFQTVVENMKKTHAPLNALVHEKMAPIESQIRDLEDSKQALTQAFENIKKEKIRSDDERIKNESILASIGEGLVVVSPDERVTFINEYAAHSFKIEKDAILGKKYTEIFVLEDSKGNAVPYNDRPFTIALKTGKKFVSSINRACVYRRRDGTKFPSAITVTPIVRDRKIDGAVIIFRDITREREIDETKNEFINLASHQIRTPITAINWYVEMLLDDSVSKLTDEQKVFALEIKKSNKRIIDLVSVFLDVSRIELGIFNSKIAPTDMQMTIEDLLMEMKTRFDEKKLVVAKIYDNNIPKCETDERLVRVISDNLISNAIQYSGVGGEIAISIKKKDANVCISVHDNGIGILPEDSAHIFTKFFRSNSARNVKPDGNGLGLYIVKKIIEELGGSIGFESSPGQGTTFMACFPQKFVGKPEKK